MASGLSYISDLIRKLTVGTTPEQPAPDIAVPAAVPEAPPPEQPVKKAKLIRLAVIGGGMHGAKSIKAILKAPDCRITYICDVDEAKGKARAQEIRKATGKTPKTVTDFRVVLDDPTVHGVVIVTPHHWHALAAVMALKAGKHVYIEKPVTHCFAEGPVLRAAAHRYRRVVMPGTQLRSNLSLMAAGDFMQAGELGAINFVHCIIHKARPALPMTGPAEIPETVNYDMWVGPRPDKPLTRSKFHYHWHWFWDFGNGALGNNGIHRIDAARLALGLKGRGDLVLSIGGKFGPKDMSETPNTQLCLYKFGEVWLLQDILGVKPKAYRDMDNAVIFHGEKGVIVYTKGVATLCDLDFNPIRTFEGAQQSHYEHFLTAIRQKKIDQSLEELNEAIISSDLCHFGNISHRVGENASDATILSELDDLGVPAIVKERFRAMRENIRDAGDGDAPLTLGQTLRLQEGETPFSNLPENATWLLYPEEREPFTLPKVSSLFTA
jgi:predicted dehydrogenase